MSTAEEQQALLGHAGVDPNTYVLPDKMNGNFQTLDRIRTFIAVVSGAVAGLLGLTGILGFIFWVVCGYIGTYILSKHIPGPAKEYFPQGSGTLFSVGSILGTVQTFVCVWMVAYDCIYVF